MIANVGIAVGPTVVTRTFGYVVLCVVGVAALVGFNVGVLGLGEPDLLSYEAYFFIWLAFYLPLVVLGAITAAWKSGHMRPPIRRRLLLVYALLMFVFLELSMLLDLKWPWVVAQYPLGLICFLGARGLAVARERRVRSE